MSLSYTDHEFDQDSAKETASIRVPSGSKSAYISVPVLDSCTLTVAGSMDGGTLWGTRAVDLDGLANPRAAYTGGGATYRDVIWIDVAGVSHIKIVSSVAQTSKVARVKFKD